MLSSLDNQSRRKASQADLHSAGAPSMEIFVKLATTVVAHAEDVDARETS
jgi:hypothetical protein